MPGYEKQFPCKRYNYTESTIIIICSSIAIVRFSISCKSSFMPGIASRLSDWDIQLMYSFCYLYHTSFTVMEYAYVQYFLYVHKSICIYTVCLIAQLGCTFFSLCLKHYIIDHDLFCQIIEVLGEPITGHGEESGRGRRRHLA